SKLYFRASEYTNGPELWVSDGTEAGTIMLKDINTDSGIGSYPGNFIKRNNELFFTADGGNGTRFELWKTNGTAAGTVLVKDIKPTGSSSANSFILHNNLLYFTADNGTDGEELWISNGTEAGTV